MYEKASHVKNTHNPSNFYFKMFENDDNFFCPYSPSLLRLRADGGLSVLIWLNGPLEPSEGMKADLGHCAVYFSGGFLPKGDFYCTKGLPTKELLYLFKVKNNGQVISQYVHFHH